MFPYFVMFYERNTALVNMILFRYDSLGAVI